MPMTRRDRPALTTLHAFVVAARHESIRHAADELGITASAVSHQIRKLEDWIGAAVFMRAPRQIRLTPLGKRLYRQMSGGFDSIETAIVSAREGTIDTVLRVSALPLFTSAWLIPRLERFDAVCAKARLKISIEIDTSSALTDFDTSRVDVAIRNLMCPDAKLVSRKLVDLSAVPLCAPRVARSLAKPEDLEGVTLIHISGRADGWRRWLKASGLKPIEPRANLTFDTIPAALEAALAGRGVMLGLDPVIWDVPAVTRLVIPFKVKRISAGSYFVVYRHSDRMRRAVTMFADWLVDEVRADARRLSTVSRAARAAVRQYD
jgi:LysR family glycine cleavage system transcriptional activator